MADFLNSWGGLIGLIGAVLSLFGLAASIWAVYRAGKARDAAEAARRETRVALTRALATVDLERAIALVQRLKELHQETRWEVSAVLYQTLRVMLIDIAARCPADAPQWQLQLQAATLQVTEIDNAVSAAIGEGNEPPGRQNFNEVLNDIQVNLERMSSFIQLPTDGTREGYGEN